MSPVIALNVKASVKPDRREEFLKYIKADADGTMAMEPGALQFVLGEDTETPNVFYFHEQYKSKSDLEYHQTTKHFKDFLKFAETDPFTEDLVITEYECQHDPVKNTNKPAYCLNVELCIQPEVREEFLKVIDNNQKGSRQQEPLCLQYDYGESVDTPNSFYFHEEYEGADAGKEGFDAHAKAPHFAKWEEFAATNPFTKPPVVSFYRSIE